MLKFKRETSRTSAIIWLITEHTAMDHNRRFFLETSMLDNGPGACSNGGPNEILAVRTDDFRELWLCINVFTRVSKKLLNAWPYIKFS